MKKIVIFLVFISTLIMAVPSNAAGIYSIKKQNTKVSMYNGVTKIFRVKKYASKSKTAKWSSSRKSIATVDKNGQVITKKPGKTVIKCKIQGKTYLCNLTVKARKMTSLKFSLKKMTLYKGNTSNLTAKVSPENTYNKKIKYTSSNVKVVTVSQSGTVKAVSPGTAKITAKAQDGSGKTASCTITVKKNKLSYTKDTIKIYVGEQASQIPVISDPTKDNNSLTYCSSNETIASVDSSGLVTGLKKGIVTVTATLKTDPGVSASYKVQVVEKLTKNSFKYVAHRGLSSEAPENTAMAFTLAGQAGFWGAETDVRVTKDGEFILLHDASFSRMCGDSRKPEDMSLDEIKELTITSGNNIAKYKNEESAIRICTLKEYLSICKTYQMVPVIEIKISRENYEIINGTALQTLDDTGSSTWHELMSKLDDTVRSVMGNSTYAFISFEDDAVSEMSLIRSEKNESNMKLQYLFSSATDRGSTVDNNLAFCKQYGAAWNIQDNSTSLPGLVSKAKNAGLEVNVWTVDDRSRAEIINLYDVNYITTNRIIWQY